MKKSVLRIISILIALTFVISAFVGCDSETTKAEKQLKREIKAATPVELLKMSVQRTTDAAEKTMPKDTVVQKTFNGGSIGIKIEIPETATVEGKIYADIAGKKGAVLANANIPALALDVDLSAYITDKELVVGSKKLLGNTYGIKYDTVIDDLKASIFAPGNSLFSMEEEEFNSLLDTVNTITSEITKLGTLADDLKTAVLNYFALFINGLSENAALTVENDKVITLGKDVDARIVTVEIDSAKLVVILKNIWEEAKKDTQIKGIFDTLSGFNESLSIEKIDEFVEIVENENKDKPAKFKIDVAVDAATGAVVRIDFGYELTEDGNKTSADLSLELGTFEKFEGFVFYGNIIKEDSEGNKDINRVDVSLSVDDTETAKAIKVGITFDDVRINADFNADKVNGKYTFTLTDKPDNIDVEISGKYSEVDGCVNVSVDSLKSNGELELPEGIKIELTFNANDKMPEIPEYKTLRDISMTDLVILNSIIEMFAPADID